jgi:hypothetical protein
MEDFMTVTRSCSLIVVLTLVIASPEAFAQGRGKGKAGKAARNSGGPAFCRSGAGHPVFGMEWCYDRGWSGGNGNTTGVASRRAQTRGQVSSYPDRYGTRRSNDVAFDNGYADGYEKGLDDGQHAREVNPTRHAWYRSADRNYDASYGSRAQYANVYRDGFKSGYEAGHADGRQYGKSDGSWWPF